MHRICRTDLTLFISNFQFRASSELWAGAHHDIEPDGYNLGRDRLVARALLPTRWSPTLDGIWWKSEGKL
jgi:hypothetical protein